MIGTQRRGRETINIWPGFVDALATILLVFVFVLLLFVVAQFYLSDVLSGRNRALEELRAQVNELAETLSLERSTRTRLEEQVSELYSELHATLTERDNLRASLQLSREQEEQLRAELAAKEDELEVSEEKLQMRLTELASLQGDISRLREVRDELEAEVGDLASRLESTRTELGQERDRSKALEAELADTRERTQLAQKEIEQREMRIQDLVAEIEERNEALSQQKDLTADAQTRIQTLQREIRALQDQIASLSSALELSQAKVATQRSRIEDLGERLNLALAEKVKELSSYRSEFFGRMREVLGDIPEIRIVGDRFLFQSELFFESGSAEIGGEGRQKLRRVAEVLTEVSERIPGEIDWVLQVEGHTDRRPISTSRFPSNWELSTARATNIVHYLVGQGIPPRNLAAAGFGQYQPIDSADTPEAYGRNRRIEFKLTSR